MSALTRNYRNLFLDAGVESFDEDKYSRCLDAVLATERVPLDRVLGVDGTAGGLCVVDDQGVAVAHERGIFNRRVEVDRVLPLGAVARVRKEIEGFKGRGGLSIIGYDADGRELGKVNWGLSGPEWVAPFAEQQSMLVYQLICRVMDEQ